MKMDVKTYNVIAKEGLAVFPAERYTINQSEKPAALLIRSQDMHKTYFGTNVLAIARAGAGVNNIPLIKAAQNGTVVFNTPGSNANAVKELIVAMLILSSRPVVDAANWAKKVVGADVSLQTEKGKNHFAGTELVGKTIGVIGLGNVGSRVAQATASLGMNVIGYDPYISVEHAWKLSNQIPRAKKLAEMLPKCDYLTIHIPYTEKNRDLITSKELTQLKPGAILLNYSRWGIVNEDDVITALNHKTLKKYVTDFSSNKIIGHPQIIITPHIGGTTVEAEINGAKMAAQTLRTYLETGNIINSVNFPTVELPFESSARITLIHKNVPNMVGRITTILANDGINIDNMINKSRDEFAYTMIDMGELNAQRQVELKKELLQIPEVIRVRVLKREA